MSKKPEQEAEPEVVDLKNELIDAEVDKRVAIILRNLQSGTIQSKGKDEDEVKMIFIDKNFWKFIVKHKKAVLFGGICFACGFISAYILTYIICIICGFIVGYCFRYYYLFKNPKKDEK